LLAGAAVAVLVGGCGATRPAAAPSKEAAAGHAVGDPAKGRQLFVAKGCGACHQVRGISEAAGTIGPSLTGFAGRPTIAGSIPNTPENLERWLRDPPAVKPGSMMPNLGLSEQEAAEIAAFLQTLR
jgi:cytochrome c1